MPPTPDVTRLLQAWCNGDPAGLDRLVPFVYTLHRLAHRHMLGERHAEHPLGLHELLLREPRRLDPAG